MIPEKMIDAVGEHWARAGVRDGKNAISNLDITRDAITKSIPKELRDSATETDRRLEDVLIALAECSYIEALMEVLRDHLKNNVMARIFREDAAGMVKEVLKDG